MKGQKTKKIYYVLLWLFILVLLFICPNHYSFYYNLTNLSVFLVYLFLYLKDKNKKTYFDFDVLFLTTFAVTSYSYPVFLYDNSFPFVFFFGNSFKLSNISYGVIASTIAGCLYMLGGSLNYVCSRVNYSKSPQTKRLVLLAIILSLLFWMLGGFQYYSNRYLTGTIENPNGRILQIEALLQSTIVTAISLEYYKLASSGREKNRFREIIVGHSFNRTLFVLCLIVGASIAISGNRTTGMILTIPLLFVIFNQYTHLGLGRFFIGCLIAFLMMFVIQITRAGDSFDSSVISAAGVVSDLVIPSRSNFLVFEVINEKGLSYGITTLRGFISSIPSLDSYLNTIGIDTKMMGSAYFFTDYTEHMGHEVKTGLGTTLQADLMLSFGWLGLIFFFFIGRGVNVLYMRMKNGHYYSTVVYFSLICFSVFWVRAELSYPFRVFVWSLIMSKIILILDKKKKYEK